MSDKPGVKTQGRRQLTMFLPITGGVSRSVPLSASDDDRFRQALLHQLEKSGLRKHPSEAD